MLAEFTHPKLDEGQLTTAQLRLVLFADRLEYAAVAPQNAELLLLGAVPFTPGQPLVRSLEHALAVTSHLKAAYAGVELAFALPHWALIPKDFLLDAKLTPAKFLEALHGTTPEQYEIRGKDVRPYALEVCYAYPHALKSVLAEKLPQAQLTHVVAHLLEVSQQLDDRLPANLTLHIALLGSHLYLTLIRGNDLIFCNGFEAAYAEDALYYAVSTLQQLGADPKKSTAYITGSAPYRATLQGLLEQAVGEVPLVSAHFRQPQSFAAVGRGLDEMAYLGTGLLAPSKV